MKDEKIEYLTKMKRYVEIIIYRMELSKKYNTVLKWFQTHDSQCIASA